MGLFNDTSNVLQLPPATVLYGVFRLVRRDKYIHTAGISPIQYPVSIILKKTACRYGIVKLIVTMR